MIYIPRECFELRRGLSRDRHPCEPLSACEAPLMPAILDAKIENLPRALCILQAQWLGRLLDVICVILFANFELFTSNIEDVHGQARGCGIRSSKTGSLGSELYRVAIGHLAGLENKICAGRGGSSWTMGSASPGSTSPRPRRH